MKYIVKINQRVSLEEAAHIEATIKQLRHMAQIAHSVACDEVKTCHPVMGQLVRDYLVATTHQLNCLLNAQGTVNAMYRTILEGCDEQNADDGTPG